MIAFDVVTWIPVLVFLVSAVISAIYAVYKLSSPGISSDIKFIILRRHLITIAFFLIANLFEMIGIVEYIRFGFKNQQKRDIDGNNTTYVAVLKVIY